MNGYWPAVLLRRYGSDRRAIIQPTDISLTYMGATGDTWSSVRTVWDDGNFDPSSKLGRNEKAVDADKLDGRNLELNSTPYSVVQRDNSGT